MRGRVVLILCLFWFMIPFISLYLYIIYRESRKLPLFYSSLAEATSLENPRCIITTDLGWVDFQDAQTMHLRDISERYAKIRLNAVLFSLWERTAKSQRIVVYKAPTYCQNIRGCLSWFTQLKKNRNILRLCQLFLKLVEGYSYSVNDKNQSRGTRTIRYDSGLG